MFRYPGYFAYQIPSLARANLQAFLNMSGSFASGLRALAELNVQTVRKMVEESNTLLSAGDEASAGDVLGWQSVMLAQFPQKAGSYGQHVLSIVKTTQDDIVAEARSQYERNGIKLNDMSKAAADGVQTAARASNVLVTDTLDSTKKVARETSGAVLGADGEIAKSSRTSGKPST